MVTNVAPAPGSAQARARLSSRGTMRPLSQGLNNVGGPHQVIACHWTIPANTLALVFIHANSSTTSATVLQGAYAPSSAPGNGIDPLDGTGAENPEGLFQQILWNGQETTVIPAASHPLAPSLSYSDPMPISVLPREDGDGALLFVRDYTTGPHTFDTFDVSTVSASNTHAYGFGGGWSQGNTNRLPFYVTPGRYRNAAMSGYEQLNCMVPHAIQAITDGPAITIVNTGDSVNSGVSAIDGILNPGLWAARLLTEQTGIAAFCLNEAVSADVSANYVARAASVLEARPSVALLQCYSRNDQMAAADSPDAAMEAYRRAIVFAAQCLDRGVVPILETAAPFCARDGMAAFEANRLMINARVRQSGFEYVDYDLILGTGANPNGFKPGCSADGVHPSTEGMKRLGEAAASRIRAVLDV